MEVPCKTIDHKQHYWLRSQQPPRLWCLIYEKLWWQYSPFRTFKKKERERFKIDWRWLCKQQMMVTQLLGTSKMNLVEIYWFLPPLDGGGFQNPSHLHKCEYVNVNYLVEPFPLLVHTCNNFKISCKFHKLNMCMHLRLQYLHVI